MYTSSCRKIRVNLPDYNFSNDLKNRILLSNLSPLEAQILQEIIYNSLSFPISELVDLVEAPRADVIKALERLSSLNLFAVENETINVDKDARKYFEVQIERFQEDFKPDLEFFQNLLSQVPIHILPTWYSLPKTSDNIFQSIIDRHLTTPKTYEKFLYDLHFDEEIALQIIEDLYASPDYSLDVDKILDKYSLTRDKLEEIIISLEFNKVCCLSYIHENAGWRQVLTPFEEWRNYLYFLRSTQPQSIENTQSIVRHHPSDFGYVEDIDILLRYIIDHGPLGTDSFLNDESHPLTALLGIKTTAEDRKRLVTKLENIRLIDIDNGFLSVTENVEIWLQKPVQEKAMAIYFSTINIYRKNNHHDGFSDRDIREVEKSLKRVLHKEWVYVDDFITGMTAAIGNSEEVTLKRTGRRWTYVIPEYTDSEKDFIKEVLFHHLFESGMVAIGVNGDKFCFCVTNFGRLSLGD